MKPIYKASEHNIDKKNKCTEIQKKRFNACYFDEKGNKLNKPDLKYLGLQEVEVYDSEKKESIKLLRSNYFIGYRWADDDYKDHIEVTSKEKENDKDLTCKADYLRMFSECLDDPTIAKKLTETYMIFFDEPWIKIKGSETVITPLIILHFLKVVKKISQKGLKKGYIKITENLTSKVKGKILINHTIKQNHFKNRLDKTVCSHQIFTINCIENQIIKTALMQCSRHLKDIPNNDVITKLLRQNINSFDLVDTKEIFNTEFSKIKHSPFYKEYQEALRLAQMIFKRFGFSLDNDNRLKGHEIPPFYINMPELFERYVEVKLRKSYPDIVDGNQVELKFEWSMRPDFLLKLKDEKFIIDAKYKYWFENSDNWDRFKDDYQQLSLYGRAKRIRKEIGLSEKEEAKLVFIYPTYDASKNIILNDRNFEDGNFEKIYKIPMYIPYNPIIGEH